jgi:hypothetical protein
MTHLVRTRLGIALGCLLAGAAYGESPPGLRALFPKQASVETTAAGPARLPLPVAVLAECRADLSDLRLLGPGDREVPFLVDRNQGSAAVRHGLRPRLLDVRRETIPAEDRPARSREVYEIAAPRPAAAWEIEIASAVDRFDRRLRVEALAEGETRILVDNASLFRVRGGAGDVQENLVVAIPENDGSRLRLTIEGDGPLLEPSFRLLRSEPTREADVRTLPLETRAREAADGWTAVEAGRAGAVVPKALRLRSTSRWFDRRVRVSDVHLGRPQATLGEGRWSRVEGAADPEPFTLALRPASGDAILVEIEDGDSPPLEDLRVDAVLPRIDLVFLAPAGAVTLLFGGGRADLPRYDLGAILSPDDPSLGADRDPPAVRLLERTNTTAATLGEPGANPAFDERPLLGFAMRPGATVDPAPFTHRSTLEIRPSAEGVARLRLGAAELAVARADLADLRIVGSEGRQWPYVLGARAASDHLPLSVGTRESRDGRSRYEIGLPVAPLEILALELESDARFLDRGFELFAKLDGGPAEEPARIAGGRLRRRERSRERGPLRVDVQPRRVRSLVLEIDDGSEEPISFRAMTARVRLPEIFVTAPAGRYSLLLGDPAAEPPRYELAAVSAVVRSVGSTTVSAGPLEPNPDHRRASRLPSARDLETIAFWAALIVAAAVLGGLTLRLARQTS